MTPRVALRRDLHATREAAVLRRLHISSPPTKCSPALVYQMEQATILEGASSVGHMAVAGEQIAIAS